MALVKSIVFVDGENLTFRFQAMQAEGRVPLANVVHEPDVFVWHADFDHGISGIDTDVLRVAYYTSVVGDDDRISAVERRIAACGYGKGGDYYGHCQLNPRVFKKLKSSHKSRLVDINITIDVMRHACTKDVEVVYLFSGDGDFLELARETARNGQKICVAAFSSGLESRMRTVGDRFIDLDGSFFVQPVA